ncbi:FAD-dependent oxidoreductase [Leptolyngbyaceae cyanobacterium CCMR0082]|uniref:FAD-dependent oxidoreductase n=2 Tax=Adonisia turfae TaxID=2950184 RepID=A0A6M0S9U5_9CYAN|nr:FAD-dependent oxidoreductase [Adonisia turfae]NEZ56027.1 FAD-dependent oxidoreductase [Adonisia turfae CCMR0081]NEZ65255.1 FAD-dependent oxidoreductase [Adonisia turfae CCMR0082]
MNPFPETWQTPDISRRSALKLLGVGAVGGTLGYTRFAKPQPTLHQVDRLDLPQTVGRATKAIIVGGGLAGLATAYELSKRGMAVTLLERSPQLGGKIASWPIQVGDHELRMEHGFHGFFPQYYNLFSLVDELKAQDNFQSLNFYAVLYKNGYKPEAFYPSNAAFPWNIVDLAVSSENRLKWGINLTKLKHLEVFREITSFRMPQTYERLDHLSVEEWGQGQFPKGLYDLYFLPFAKSSLNSPDVLSAGELMQFFHFYFFGNPEGLAFNGTCEDMGRCLVDPLSHAIETNGGQILTGVTVSQINWADGKIASVDYQKGNIAVNPVPFWCDRNPLLSTDTTEYFGAGDRLFVVDANSDQAISLTCTHQGCSVHKEVAANGDGFVCPCHGATYAGDGQVMSGPAQENLAQFKVLKRENNRIQLMAANPVKNAEGLADSLEADYFIFAADIPGIKNLFALSQGEPNSTVMAQISQLQVADPFAVGRFWLDRDFEWEHSWFTSLSGYDLTDSITLYHKVQGDYTQWAAETGGSVVELHAYCYKEKEFPTQQALLDTFKRELWEIVPDLEGANILHQELVNQKNFAGFPPGSYPNRPSSATAVPNLLFAGDWVKMPFPCGLMERAVSSGLLAANEVLHREGSARRPLMSVNPEGVFKV